MKLKNCSWIDLIFAMHVKRYIILDDVKNSIAIANSVDSI